MKKPILIIIVVLLVAVIVVGGVKIYQGLHAYDVIEEYYDTAAQYIVEEMQTPEITPEALSEAPLEPQAPVSTLEEDSTVEEISLVEELLEPVEKPPITIDFESLLKDSPDVIGWLYASDGSVNLPVVQGTDNQYYLTHLPNGNYSSGGSLFLDYLNNSDLTDEVSFIYGHNMKNGTMLQPILAYEAQNYYDANPIMYFLTPEKNYKLELFAGILTGVESDVYTFNFDSDESKQAFIDDLVAQSTFMPNRIPEAEEALLCLSTCAYDFENARYVVFASVVEMN